MDSYTVQLDTETEKFITIYLYTDVENIKDVRNEVITGKIPCCIIKAGLIVDPFQVVVAANKAVVSEKFGKLTTKTIAAEILFNLSLTKNITQSLKNFGIDETDENIVVAIVHDAENEEILSKDVLAMIKGQRTPIARLAELNDVTNIKKTYKIAESELKVSSVVDCIVSKMNTKTFSSH